MTNIENMNDVENRTAIDVSLDETKIQATEALLTKKMPEVIREDGVLTINWLAEVMWMEKQLLKLSNSKEVMSLVWKPAQLEEVFNIINKSEMKNRLWKMM